MKCTQGSKSVACVIVACKTRCLRWMLGYVTPVWGRGARLVRWDSVVVGDWKRQSTTRLSSCVIFPQGDEFNPIRLPSWDLICEWDRRCTAWCNRYTFEYPLVCLAGNYIRASFRKMGWHGLIVTSVRCRAICFGQTKKRINQQIDDADCIDHN